MSHLGEIAAAYDGEDRELRAMIERGEAIGDLMQHPGWEHFRDWLQNQVNLTGKKVLLGNVDSLNEYKRLTGFCQGIDFALDPLSPIKALIDVRINPPEDEPQFPWHTVEPDDDDVPDGK